MKYRFPSSGPAAPRGYSTTQVALHWVIAALVAFQLLFGESMGAVMEAEERGRSVSALDSQLAAFHYWIGIGVLVLVAIRFGLRTLVGVPEATDASPRWAVAASNLAHNLFYVLLVSVPVTGLLGYYLKDPWSEIHAISKPAFLGLIAVHVAGALYHQFWLKDRTLTRMLVPTRGVGRESSRL